MFRSKDALSDLVEFSRAGGDIDERRIETLIEELKATIGVAGDESASTSSGEAEEIDFQPLTLSIDDLALPGDEPADVDRHYVITFTPRRELYRKGNEPARLLRELGQLGEVEAVCDATALPRLEDLDPEGAYLAWRIDLKTDKPSTPIEEVFDFVVDDCELAIVPRERAPEPVDEEPAQATAAMEAPERRKRRTPRRLPNRASRSRSPRRVRADGLPTNRQTTRPGPKPLRQPRSASTSTGSTG